MKHITIFNSVAQAEACPGLYTPQVCMVEGQSRGLVFAKNSGVEGETITINVDPSGKIVPVYQNPDFVDLGLPSGRLWCKYNVGATCQDTSTSWYGNYYAWGETEPKNNYGWSTYAHCTPDYDPDESEGSLTKYTGSDGKPVLEPGNDAATVNEGQGQRMPTSAEYEELLANTVSTRVNNYKGISGLNGRTFSKATIISPAFIAEGVTLYSPFDENLEQTETLNEITPAMWMNLSVYTKPELDAIVRSKTGGKITDVGLVIFKSEFGEETEYGIDYGFVNKVSDGSGIHIFIPAAGFMSGSSLISDGSFCSLWSSSLALNYPYDAWNLFFNLDAIRMGYGDRYDGRSVRSVL